MMTLEEVGAHLGKRFKELRDDHQRQLDELRKEVNELRDRVARLEGSGRGGGD